MGLKFPLPRHFLHLIRGNTKAFPDQTRDSQYISTLFSVSNVSLHHYSLGVPGPFCLKLNGFETRGENVSVFTSKRASSARMVMIKQL